MTPEHQEYLRATYPLVYPGPFYNDEPFRVGDGWFPILDLLSRTLQSCIATYPEEERRHLGAVQVKEKFGLLRFYTTSSNAQMDTIIEVATLMSEFTCDVCGKPGTLQTNKGEHTCFIATRCAAHEGVWERP